MAFDIREKGLHTLITCAGSCRQLASPHKRNRVRPDTSPPRLLAWRVATLCAAVSLLSGCCLRVSMVDVGPLVRQNARASIVSAHRGSVHSGFFPDNSLPALQEAAEAGVELLEVDVRRSIEGELFLFHDGSLNSGNSYAPPALRGWPIAELTRAERAKVFLDKHRRIPIPTLDQALSLVASTQSSLQLDLKGESDTLALSVADLVSRRGMLPRVIFQIRKTSRIRMLKEQYPGIRIIARCLSMEQLRQALEGRVEMVELERWISSEAIALAHAHKVYVLLNIASSRLDQPTTRGYFRTRGIDAIMTNFGATKDEPS